MRSMIKYPLLALASVFVAQLAMSNAAIAGSVPVALPDSGSSGISDNFIPFSDVPDTTIEEGALSTLQSYEQSDSVPTVSGESLPISSQQTSVIQTALQSGTNNSLAILGQQLSNEMGGSQPFVVSSVGNSPGAVQAAVDSFNNMVLGFDSQQLAAAAESPTFMSLSQMLRNASATLNSDSNIAFDEGSGEFGLLTMNPTSVSTPEPIPVEPVVVPDPGTESERQVDAGAQSPAPETRQPIRGLW